MQRVVQPRQRQRGRNRAGARVGIQRLRPPRRGDGHPRRLRRPGRLADGHPAACRVQRLLQHRCARALGHQLCARTRAPPPLTPRTRDALPCLPPPAPPAGFWGLEKLHPFDSKKFQRVLAILEQRGVLAARQLVQAHEATLGILGEVHSEPYLRRLHSSSFKVAMVRPAAGAVARVVSGREPLRPTTAAALLAALAQRQGRARPRRRAHGRCTPAPHSRRRLPAGDGAGAAALPPCLPAAVRGLEMKRRRTRCLRLSAEQWRT